MPNNTGLSTFSCHLDETSQMTISVTAAFLTLARLSRHAFFHCLSVYFSSLANKYFCITCFSISTVTFFLTFSLLLLIRYRNYNLSPKHDCLLQISEAFCSFFFTNCFEQIKSCTRPSFPILVNSCLTLFQTSGYVYFMVSSRSLVFFWCPFVS